MPNLSICLLGPFQATLGGEPIKRFESNKVRALLAYLAVEAGREHSRSVLAGLLWPDCAQSAALGNLRHALSSLRRTIDDRNAHPPFLLISRDTVQFNPASDYELDIAAFDGGADPQLPAVGRLEHALSLRRGSFLEGLSIGDSPAFEEWVLLKREQVNQELLRALRRLAEEYERKGEYAQARLYAWRQVELEPCEEEGHRQLMRLLALDGQRSAALAQYQTCRRLLMQEMGVEPADETVMLYERISAGALSEATREETGTAAWPARPLFLDEDGAAVAGQVFVGRESELKRLNELLRLALAGQGQLVFVTGDAGLGKTMLVQQFLQGALAAHHDVIAAQGNGNAHTGVGDPCLPFIEILQALTGEVQAQPAGGAMTREQARRLWELLPLSAQALLEVGPDLVGRFGSGPALVARARAFASRNHAPTQGSPGQATHADGPSPSWLEGVEKLVQRNAPTVSPPAALQQADLFEQYVQVLRALSRQRPLVLVLDDLQWADAGSIGLLFQLGRKLAGCRILLIGAYRPSDVALGRGGERHPLEPVVHELQRERGDVTVDLTQAEGRSFVDAFLDAIPNRLGEDFRRALFEQTGGHPLFTVELLRGLQERGGLVQDRLGQWVATDTLDWDRLPARVEAVIAEHIARLPPPCQALLAVASVEGSEFTAEVVARAQGADQRDVTHLLSSELTRRYRLVSASGCLRLGEQRLSRYRFRHYLFQKYLYGQLDDVERSHVHEAVGNALEALYGDHAGEIAVSLAWHFAAAGQSARAVSYSLEAGRRAGHLAANQEALTHLQRGQEMLVTLPPSPERDRLELALQLALSAPLRATGGYGSAELGRVYARARALCQRVGAAPELYAARFGLATLFGAQADYRPALEIVEQLLQTAQQTRDASQLALACSLKGYCQGCSGDLVQSCLQLERALTLYDPQDHALFDLYGVDQEMAALWLALALICLGHAGRANQLARKAIAQARASGNPLRLAYTLSLAGAEYNDFFLRDYQAALKFSEEVVQLGSETGPFQAYAFAHLGRMRVRAGEPRAGIGLIRRGLDAMQAMGHLANLSFLLCGLAEAYGWAGQATEGLQTLAEASSFVERTGERSGAAELCRVRGDLLLMSGDDAGAEASYLQGIRIAGQQEARLFELRATVALCRLWQGQGKQQDALRILAALLEWFGEERDTPDLRDARALLATLA